MLPRMTFSRTAVSSRPHAGHKGTSICILRLDSRASSRVIVFIARLVQQTEGQQRYLYG